MRRERGEYVGGLRETDNARVVPKLHPSLPNRPAGGIEEGGTSRDGFSRAERMAPLPRAHVNQDKGTVQDSKNIARDKRRLIQVFHNTRRALQDAAMNSNEDDALPTPADDLIVMVTEPDNGADHHERVETEGMANNTNASLPSVETQSPTNPLPANAAGSDKNDFHNDLLRALMHRKDVKVIVVKRQPDLLAKAQEIERRTKRPLSTSDPSFPWDRIKMLSDPALYYVIIVMDGDSKDIVFAIIQDCFKTMLEYSTVARHITTNSAQRHPEPEPKKPKTKETKKSKKNNKSKSKGTIMPSNTVVNAQPIGEDTVSELRSHGTGESVKSPPVNGRMKEKGKDTMMKVPAVAQVYCENFMTIMPGAALQLAYQAAKEGVPGFDTLTLDGTDPARPFANSLIMSCMDFSNFFHRDNNWSPATYVKGGKFVLVEYGVGVNSAKAGGCLVEIFWRGSIDYHATCQSEQEPGYTQWGSSIQLTTGGVKAM
ncbi:hypothetical protein EIP91_011271 [Steccherinum ochraceum]|uniref:Tet-like 2OG-Fe(II) oxygenase domain-containing protein n=1 Tax=Steccherinum ochraceum TaxID=92696 RepID=A0A4R0R1Z7_9APHY|nr:hypothetical protein EIP91_011271 [Steccherinum ochraceum]